MTPETFRKWATIDTWAGVSSLLGAILFGLIGVLAANGGGLVEMAYAHILFGVVMFGFAAISRAVYTITSAQNERIATLQERLAEMERLAPTGQDTMIKA